MIKPIWLSMFWNQEKNAREIHTGAQGQACDVQHHEAGHHHMGIDPPPVIPSQGCQLEQAVSKVFPFQGWISGQVTTAAGQAFQQK